MQLCRPYSIFFFFNDTATTEIYTLSLHDALPIYLSWATTPTAFDKSSLRKNGTLRRVLITSARDTTERSEEHTSELQSLAYLVCRLLLEKKKIKHKNTASKLT